MRQHYYRDVCLRIVAVLVMVIAMFLTTFSLAMAVNFNPPKYYQVIYGKVTFDKSEAAAGEPFHAVIIGRVICKQDLPLSVGEGYVTTQITAEPAAGGATLLLNSEYDININPIPNKAGEMFYFNQTVTLQFPAGAAPGNYAVVAQLIEAKVKLSFLWTNVTGFFPRERTMGAIKCFVPISTQNPSPATRAAVPPSTIAPMPSQIAGATAIPSKTASQPLDTGSSNTTQVPDETPASEMSIWITLAVLILLIAVVILKMILVILERHRRT